LKSLNVGSKSGINGAKRIVTLYPVSSVQILSKNNLDGVNLRGAQLVWSDFTAANLEKAYFSVANLYGAAFKHANLIEANLQMVNLCEAKIEGRL
jgi:uncharacterized protein YjbI with pentapeptide repeats